MQTIKTYDFYYDLRTLPFVKGIWLYGSRAREDNRERSDIDLAILCPEATEAEWQQIVEIIANADTLFHIDIVRFDQLETHDPLYQNIMRDKVVLFERKINNYPWYDSFIDLGEALAQLQEMIVEPETAKPYVRDATIQRFEFSTELFWTTLKKICLYEKYDVDSPRQVLQKSFELGLIAEEALWYAMLEDRNQTSHTYKRKLASQIYYRIPRYYEAMTKAYNIITIRYKL